jgi:hypothetical protein
MDFLVCRVPISEAKAEACIVPKLDMLRLQRSAGVSAICVRK